MKSVQIAAIGLIGLSLSACASTSSSWKFSRPERAKETVANAAWLVGKGPYADDCWMYGWGCAPPGINPNITVGGPYPNPAVRVHVVETPKYIHRYPIRRKARRHRPGCNCTKG